MWIYRHTIINYYLKVKRTTHTASEHSFWDRCLKVSTKREQSIISQSIPLPPSSPLTQQTVVGSLNLINSGLWERLFQAYKLMFGMTSLCTVCVQNNREFQLFFYLFVFLFYKFILGFNLWWVFAYGQICENVLMFDLTLHRIKIPKLDTRAFVIPCI